MSISEVKITVARLIYLNKNMSVPVLEYLSQYKGKNWIMGFLYVKRQKIAKDVLFIILWHSILGDAAED